jgi:hypothetical protein
MRAEDRLSGPNINTGERLSGPNINAEDRPAAVLWDMDGTLVDSEKVWR